MGSLSCFFPELAIKWGVTNDEEDDNVSSSNRNDSSSSFLSFFTKDSDNHGNENDKIDKNQKSTKSGSVAKISTWAEVSVVLTNEKKRDSLTLINTSDTVISSEAKQIKYDVIEKHNAALFNIFCFTAFFFGIFVTITTLFLYFKNENDAVSINNRLRISSDKNILILSSLSSNTTATTKNIEINGDGISNEMMKPIKERRHDYTNNIIQKDDNNFLEDLCSEENILLDVLMKEKCLNACAPSKCCFLKMIILV